MRNSDFQEAQRVLSVNPRAGHITVNAGQKLLPAMGTLCMALFKKNTT